MDCMYPVATENNKKKNLFFQAGHVWRKHRMPEVIRIICPVFLFLSQVPQEARKKGK